MFAGRAVGILKRGSRLCLVGTGYIVLCVMASSWQPGSLLPSLAESMLSSTYWGGEDDLDIEYSLIFQQNASLMLAHCLRRWLNIIPTLPYVTSRVWWDVVGAVCDTSCESLGHQTCAA